MPAQPFYQALATEDPLLYRYPVGLDGCVGPLGQMFLMGGVTLAAGIGALERATGRPLLWATAQFLSYVREGEELQLRAEIPLAGRNVTHARLTGWVGEREVFRMGAALGGREGQPRRQLLPMPQVPPPQRCPHHVQTDEGFDDRGLYQRFERRHTGEPVANPRTAEVSPVLPPQDPTQPLGDRGGPGAIEPAPPQRHWLRSTDDIAPDAAFLAVAGDFLLGAMQPLLGVDIRTNSLDNTLRIHRLVPTEWVLCDTRMAGYANGFCHGQMDIFSESGVLLATASQTGIIRMPRGE